MLSYRPLVLSPYRPHLPDRPLPKYPIYGLTVTLDPTLSCEACAYCRLGRPQLCASGGYLGMTVDGAMADYICLPAANAIELPGGVQDHDGTLLEPLVVALHLLDRVRSLGTEGAAGLVVGGGPLGIAVSRRGRR